ncbi:hypothetical protein BC832DRAFT_542415 [Gaertneriomyces semiglobifer]|nr:hypothetical protein BC832DRAFT_542415 [Gaertneriomyces semiglobifer]
MHEQSTQYHRKSISKLGHGASTHLQEILQSPWWFTELEAYIAHFPACLQQVLAVVKDGGHRAPWAAIRGTTRLASIWCPVCLHDESLSSVKSRLVLRTGECAAVHLWNHLVERTTDMLDYMKRFGTHFVLCRKHDEATCRMAVPIKATLDRALPETTFTWPCRKTDYGEDVIKIAMVHVKDADIEARRKKHEATCEVINFEQQLKLVAGEGEGRYTVRVAEFGGGSQAPDPGAVRVMPAANMFEDCRSR